MWIERLRVNGFGMLSGREYAFRRDRINLLVDSNEQGKSTLLHALLAALYGVHRVQGGRRYSTEEEARYRPWEGKRYGVEADLQLDGRGLTIRRNLARKEVKVLREGEDATDEFRTGKALVPVGDVLTGGLSREMFLKTFCVTHAGLQAGGFGSLADPVQQALSTHDGGATAEDALAVLREALDTLGDRVVPVHGHRKADRTVAALEEQLETLRAERSELLEERLRLDRIREDRLEGVDDPEEIEETMDRLQYLHDRAARREVAARLERLRDLEEKVARERRLIASHQDVLHLALDDAELQTLEARVAEARTMERDQARLDSLREEAGHKADRIREEILSRFPGEAPPAGEMAALRDAVAVARQAGEEARRARDRADGLVEALRRQGVDVEEAEAREKAFAGIPEDHGFLASGPGPRGGSRHLDERREEAAEEHRRSALHRSPIPWAGAIMAVAGAGALSFAWGVSPTWTGLSAALAVAGLSTAIVGTLLLGQRRREALHELRQAEKKLAEARRSDQERLDRLEKVASRAGLDPETIEEDWQRYMAHHQTLEALREERRREARAEDEVRHRVDTCRDFLRSFHAERPGIEGLALLEAGLERARAWSREAERLADARREEASLRDRRDRAGRRAEESRSAAMEILGACGLQPPREAGSSLADPYRRALSRRAEALRLRDQVLPEQEARIAALERSEPERRLEELGHTIADAERRHPEWRSLEADESSDHYESERRAEEVRQRRAREAVERFHRETAEEEKAFRDRFSPLGEQIESLERDLRRAREFRDCATLALEELEAIARDSYRLWARNLNPRIEKVARALLPGLRGFGFTPDLDYTLTMDGDRTLGEEELESLSRGARAQILLAIRIGLAGYLGAACPTGTIPLLLDDPFVHFDDERHLHAVRILLEEVLPHHQVFLFSCHKVRYDHLEEQLGSRLQERVHRVEAAPTGAGAYP